MQIFNFPQRFQVCNQMSLLHLSSLLKIMVCKKLRVLHYYNVKISENIWHICNKQCKVIGQSSNTQCIKETRICRHPSIAFGAQRHVALHLMHPMTQKSLKLHKICALGMKGINAFAFWTSSLSSYFFHCSFVFGVQRAFWRVLVGAPKVMKISKTNKKLRKYGKYLVIR